MSDEKDQPESPSASIGVISSDVQFDDPGVSGAVCKYGGVDYSEGSVVSMGGVNKVCRSGSWEFTL
jgi:hypothetical protein